MMDLNGFLDDQNESKAGEAVVVLGGE